MASIIHEDADMAVCKVARIHTSGKMTLTPDAFPSVFAGTLEHDDALRAIVRNEINLSVWNKLFKKELWKDLRFPEGRLF